jgi:hypothetical protein
VAAVIAIAAIVVLAVVVGGVGWARLSSARAERRSLEGYEKTLDLLGDVAKRSDASAEVHVPRPDEVARPHVRPARSAPFPVPAKSSVRILPPGSSGSPTAGAPGPRLPVFGDADLVAQPTEPATELFAVVDPRADSPREPASTGPPAGAGDTTDLVPPREGSADDPGRAPRLVFDFDGPGGEVDNPAPGHLDAPGPLLGGDRRIRRAATGAAAAVALGAVAVGGWQLASHKATPGHATAPTTPPSRSTAPPERTRPATHHATHRTTSTSTPPPNMLRPTSTSPSLVTYAAPAGSYTLTFSATTGACWLGAQAQVNTSAYLQMWTLQPGQSATYTASGPLVVKIGAPHYVTIRLDGKPVVLPDYATPYDVSFSSSASASA